MRAFTNLPLTDRQLVDACIANSASEEIWWQLFSRFHAHLLRTVRSELVMDRATPDRVEEIVQKLWCALFANPSRLLGLFDERRCSLQTYLGALAKRRARWDAQRRQSLAHREVPLTEASMLKLAVCEFPERILREEFLACLTPTERDFFIHELHGKRSPQTFAIRSPGYRRLLLSRILHKWHVYLEGHGCAG